MSAGREPLNSVMSMVSALLWLQFLVVAEVHAQANVNDIQPGRMIVTTTNVTSYQTPPQGGSLYRIPQPAGMVASGTQLTVSTRWVVIRNPRGGEEKWVQVQTNGAWVYLGEPGSTSCCFALR